MGSVCSINLLYKLNKFKFFMPPPCLFSSEVLFSLKYFVLISILHFGNFPKIFGDSCAVFFFLYLSVRPCK